MLKWIKQKFMQSAARGFASRLAYQPSDRVRRIISSLKTLIELCDQQMDDGEWDATEKVVFTDNVMREIMIVLRGGE